MHVVDRVSFNCSRSRCGSTNVRQFGLLYVGYAMLSTTILRVGQLCSQRPGKGWARHGPRSGPMPRTGSSTGWTGCWRARCSAATPGHRRTLPTTTTTTATWRHRFIVGHISHSPMRATDWHRFFARDTYPHSRTRTSVIGQADTQHSKYHPAVIFTSHK